MVSFRALCACNLTSKSFDLRIDSGADESWESDWTFIKLKHLEEFSGQDANGFTEQLLQLLFHCLDLQANDGKHVSFDGALHQCDAIDHLLVKLFKFLRVPDVCCCSEFKMEHQRFGDHSGIRR